MKALLLLALRITTGALLIIWGSIKAFAPEAAIHVSDKYYNGALSDSALQTPMGLAQIALGALVILGLFRRITYSAQAIILVVGAAAIWKYIADPLGLYLMTEETRQVLFFPSTTVAIASLILLAFLDEDRLSLDRLLFRR
jgi:putative oxidoreductase